MIFKLKKIKYKKIKFLILLVIICFFAFRTDINIVHYYMESDKIINNIKIAVVSDLHSCNYGKNQVELISKLDNENPDIVVMPGDIIDDVLPIEKSKEFLLSVSSKYPCFYTSGNHEVWSENLSNIKTLVKKYGINVLEGDCMPVNINNNIIYISGIDDPVISKEIVFNQINDCSTSVDASKFSMLLSHRPELIDIYNKYNFDLIVSGHAHGGQWRIPFVLNGLLAPNQGFFPKYAGGIYNLKNSTLIVSRGLAKESTRIPRIFNRPEIVIIDINKK